jgi:uncharacterized protein (TIGR00106 family)
MRSIGDKQAGSRGKRSGRSRPGGQSRVGGRSRAGEKSRAAAPKEVLLEFSMTPLDKGPSVSRYVSRSLDIIDRSGIAYRLNPMGTVLEGTWPEVWRVVSACFKRMREDCERISVAIKVDYRRGQEGRLSRKIATVERRVGRKLRT